MYTLEELQHRHSVRSYTTTEIPDKIRNILRADISDVNSHMQGVRLQIFFEDNSPFHGRMGGYGLFSGVNNYVAAVVDTGVMGAYERAGYGCQQIVMSAVTQGLGTCFVSGTFNANNCPVQLRAGEKIAFIVTLGYDARKTRLAERMLVRVLHRKPMTGKDFFNEKKSSLSYNDAIKYFPRLSEALEAVACAPSAANRRIERFYIDNERNIRVYVDDYNGLIPVDMGIAKYNFSQIMQGEWDFGNDTIFYPY